MLSHGLKVESREPSRITATSVSCVDNIFTNIQQKTVVRTIELHMSDHMAQTLSFQSCEVIPEKKKTIEKRIFNTEKTYQLKRELSEVDWKNFLHNKNAEDGFSSFHELFVSLLDKWVPVKEIVIDQKEKKTSKWNTKELKDMKNKLEALQVVKTVRRDAESKKAYDIFKKIYNLKINEKIKENNENQIR
ncbi:hypothetical protein HHI36_018852 [Cryptolaemus montrouzieri]|uniref:Uncharacterized protein n=1 Tax=Cryptolaemus montrouzieri TaxID=559131 RepID=A0ABD2P146_9CUCU